MKDEYEGFAKVGFGESITGVGAGLSDGLEDYLSEEEWV